MVENGLKSLELNWALDLFNQEIDQNYLPYDGEVNYYGPILSAEDHRLYFHKLMNNIAWKHDEAFLFGKKIITKRKVAWYADSEYDYTYSNLSKRSLIWTNDLLELKDLVESKLQTKFNSCLLNLYHNGDEGVSWHSDDEKTLNRSSEIASLSFGAERKFSFKHKKTGEKQSILLQAGSLLVMKGQTQINWLHSIPKSKKIKSPRVNLTFRKML